MRLLLDTHVWLWWQMAPARLGERVREAIADTTNDVLLSTVSSWEMAIKIAVGKLQLPKPIHEMLPTALLDDQMQSLPLQHHHCFELTNLPMHHRDPFDRMLIAQARTERLVLVTADSQLGAYDVELMMARAKPKAPSKIE